ncbi:MAG TPA: hypothetical protein VGG56_07740 [Terracidiphilus sp.]|jgi:hypothetical protein
MGGLTTTLDLIVTSGLILTLSARSILHVAAPVVAALHFVRVRNASTVWDAMPYEPVALFRTLWTGRRASVSHAAGIELLKPILINAHRQPWLIRAIGENAA